MPTTWKPGLLACPAHRAGARLSRHGGARRRRGASFELSAAGFCRRGRASSRSRLPRWRPAKPSLLQGGDCDESFAEHGADNIRDFFRVFLQMAVVLTYGARPAGGEGRPYRRPVRQAAFQVDRDHRWRRAAVLPGRHHQRHGFHAGIAHSRPAAARKWAYRQSAATLNLLRAFASGGYANLDNVHKWTLGFVKGTQSSRYQEYADRITESLAFMRACGIHPESVSEMRTTDFYTSHEALLLGYEQALTRVDSTTGGLVRHVWPHDLGRRPYPPARPCPYRNTAVASRTRSASSAARRWRRMS